MRSTTLLSFLLATGCAWEPQPHPEQGPPDNVIAGTVVATGVEDPNLSILLVTDASNPPPPAGTGAPLTLSTVPQAQFTGEGAGIQAASYAITGVPDGDWLITGLMDMDRDFHPSIGALAGATCGDIGGAHLADLTTQELAAVTVSGGELLDDVTVTLGSEFPLERPAFTLVRADGTPGRPRVSLTAAAQGGFETFRVRSTAVHAAFVDDQGDTTLAYDLEGPFDPEGRWAPFTGEPVCETAFYGWVKDSDADGEPDPHPSFPVEAGIPDIWPRFGLTWLGTPLDTDGDGIADVFHDDLDPGESWTSLSVVSPLSVLLTGELPIGTPFLTDHLEVLFVPAANHTYVSDRTDCDGVWEQGICSEVVQDPAQIPTGAWGVTAITETGQTWGVPNELATTAPTEAGFDPLGQWTWVWVQD